MLPFFLFQTGAPSQQAGFNSLLGFWSSGAGGSVTVVPPVVGGFGRRGRRYVKAEQHRSFSRKYFDELRAAERAMEAALLAADKAKNVERQEALETAGLQAQEALEAIHQQEQREQSLARLTKSLEAATNAKSLAAVLKRSNDAKLAAAVIIGALKFADEEEEEEAIALLLLH